jgi:hypothetical protein
VVLIGAASPAAADPVAILDSTILGAPRVQIFSPPTTPAISLDRTFSDSNGSYHAVMEDGTNQIALKGLMQAAVPSQAFAELINIIDDQLTFQNLSAPTLVTFHLIAVGTGLLPTTLIDDQTFVGVAQLILSNAFGGAPPTGITDNPGINVNISTQCGTPFPLCLQESADTTFPLAFDFTQTRLVTNNTPLDFALEMQLFGAQGAQLDFLNTARLVFDLPPGASVTSIGGFSSVGTLPTPEPPSIMILATAILLLGSGSLPRLATILHERGCHATRDAAEARIAGAAGTG